MKKKLLSMILALVMLLTVLPMLRREEKALQNK